MLLWISGVLINIAARGRQRPRGRGRESCSEPALDAC